MPIKDPSRYPDNWKEIRALVLVRARNCCEGSPAFPTCRVPNYSKHPVTGSKVVLTIAHLDHKPENNEFSNLRAWCQRCHNTYDAPFRALNRKITRLEREIQAFSLCLATALAEKRKREAGGATSDPVH